MRSASSPETAHAVDGGRGAGVDDHDVQERDVRPGLADSTFEFDPPANATVETLDVPKTTTYDSVRALRSNAEMAVPTPELPPRSG